MPRQVLNGEAIAGSEVVIWTDGGAWFCQRGFDGRERCNYLGWPSSKAQVRAWCAGNGLRFEDLESPALVGEDRKVA